MDNAHISKKVLEIISEQLEIEVTSIHLDAHFRDDLGASSTDMIAMILQLEDSFDFEMPPEDVERITNVQVAIDYVTQQVKQSSIQERSL